MSVKTIVQKFPVSSADIKTLQFKQDNIHDFAWFADKRFIVNHDTCRLASGKIIDVFTYYTPAAKKDWSKQCVILQRMRYDIIQRMDGEYPYNVVSVVQGPESFGGGMEYPTITVISPTEDEKILDYTIAHEIGHNWFYGILASNEREYPWMDEGMNTYYDNRYSKWKHGDKGEMTIGAGSVPIKNWKELDLKPKPLSKEISRSIAAAKNLLN